MKTAYLGFSPVTENNPTKENFSKIDGNTGNIVYDYSIQHTIKCKFLARDEMTEKAYEYQNFIVTDFIWIREGIDRAQETKFEYVMNVVKDKPIICLGVGLQAPYQKSDFKIHQETLRVLSELSERSVLGVRGYYTAEILNKFGIKNIQVIGCPSLYLYSDYSNNIQNHYTDSLKAVSNYKTLSKSLKSEDYKILSYLAKKTDFIEQTPCYFPNVIYQNLSDELKVFLFQKKHIFFDFEDWFSFLKDYNFSIGARFHRNVISILSGIPALFLTFDSRTKEMTDFFYLPSLDVSQMDLEKSLDYYYEMADYSQFKRNFPKLLDNFAEFCIKNHLEMQFGMADYFQRKLNKLEVENINLENINNEFENELNKLKVELAKTQEELRSVPKVSEVIKRKVIQYVKGNHRNFG